MKTIISRLLLVLLVLGLFGGMAVLTMGSTGAGRVDLFESGFRIDETSGTIIKLLAVGTVDINNGATTGAATVTGLATGDIPVITPNETWGSATEFHAICTANTLTVTVDTDPGTTVTVNYAVFGL